MNEKNIVKRSASDRRKGKTDWERVKAMTEEEIDEAARSDPDAQPTDAEFWKDAEIVLPDGKERITVRFDKEVLDWFRKQGKGYQTRMNAVLRTYMEAKSNPPEDRPG